VVNNASAKHNTCNIRVNERGGRFLCNICNHVHNMVLHPEGDKEFNDVKVNCYGLFQGSISASGRQQEPLNMKLNTRKENQVKNNIKICIMITYKPDQQNPTSVIKRS
jgi:hypothetical protein